MPVEGLGLGRDIPACRNTDFFPPTAYIAATTGASPRIFGRVYLSAFRRRVMTSFFEQMLKHHIFAFYGYLYPMNPGTSAFACVDIARVTGVINRGRTQPPIVRADPQTRTISAPSANHNSQRFANLCVSEACNACSNFVESLTSSDISSLTSFEK